MAHSFKLSIIDPDKVIYEGEAVSLVAPSALGYFGVLAGHAPLIAGLTKGKIIIRESSGKTVTLDSRHGFIEVLENKVSMILR